MNFNTHSELADKHAVLGASKYHWVNYDDEKFDSWIRNMAAVQKGTELHKLAADLIKHRQKLPNTKQTMNMYVNDAIGYRMSPEQVLVPIQGSYNAFGTVDAISFHRNRLRIHDLKTGVSPASMKQLEIYTGYTCLEYGLKPQEIQIELRIYQNDEVLVHVPEVEDILDIMEKTIRRDRQIDLIRAEAMV